MAENVRRTKRVVVSHRYVIPLALVAGVAAYWAPASPTGSDSIDAALVTVGTAALTWIGAAASWWVLIVASGTALSVGLRLDLVILAAIALMIALRIGMHQRNHSVLRAVTVGILLNVLLRSELQVFAGLSTIIGLVTVALIYGSGTRRRTDEQRRWIHGVLFFVIFYSLSTGVIMSASALAARNNLESALNNLQTGMNQLSSGEIDQAGNTFRSASKQLQLARDRINAFWTQPSRVVPVVAQHRRAIDDLSNDAAELIDVIAAELDRLDLDSLQPVNGAFDLVAIQRAADSVTRLRNSIFTIDDTVASTRSMWLVAQLQNEIDELSDEIVKQRDRVEDVRVALTHLPSILGQNEPRRYFIAFTTPAEARGSGGFMGSWAELSANEGRITLKQLGRTSELNSAGSRNRQVSGPDDFLSTWGRYGFTSAPSGKAEQDVWSNITIGAHFPSTGQVISELYPQSGGDVVDGVFALDIKALTAFLDFTGPVTVPGLTTPLTTDNAEQFLLFDQYQLDGDINRVDVLEDFSREVVNALLNGGIPGPRQLVEGLAPMVRESRIVGFATREDEQDLFERLNMSGALPDVTQSDGIAVAFNNASASKLELFFDASMDYTFSVDGAGDLQGTLDLTLTNSAPTSGWSEGVIGNYFDLPVGTNQIMVTVYSRFAPIEASFGGEPIDPIVGIEAGYVASSYFVVLEPDQTEILRLNFQGRLNDISATSSQLPLVVRTPAMVRPFPIRLTYTNPQGRVLVAVADRPGIFIRPLGSENLTGE